MADKSDIAECKRKQLEKIAKTLWIHRVASVHIGEEGIVVVLENNQKLFFKSDKDKPVSPDN